MQVLQMAKQVPFVMQFYKGCRVALHSGATRRALRQLSDAPHVRATQVASAVCALDARLSASDQTWIDRIEAERGRLLSRHEPLVNGRLGAGGPFDGHATIGQACRVSKPPRPARLLYVLARTAQPLNVIELGTNVGVSSAYIAAALQENGRGGRVVTLDASAYRQQVAADLHRRLGLDNVRYVHGLFAETLLPSLRAMGAVDMAFIDGHHQYQPTMDYFEAILPFASPQAVLAFDDIRWSDGMRRAWSRLQADPRLGLVVDLDSLGVCAPQQADSGRVVSPPIFAF